MPHSPSPDDLQEAYRKTVESTLPASLFTARGFADGTQHWPEVRVSDSDRAAADPREASVPLLEETSLGQRIVKHEAGAGPTLRYTIGELLGSGSSGTVFRATDHNLDREIAIKFLRRGDSAQEEKVARFIHEARVTARLEHPNILPIHDLEYTQDGRIYFSMRKAQGTSLGELLRRALKGAPLPAPVADLYGKLNVFMKVCEAVAYAHHKGVIHQDVKPDNIMIGDFGEVVLVDWGTAYSPAETDPQHYRLMGTPAYMSPEQARGEPADVRSDVYCLGATLYYLLTLHYPTWSEDPAEFWELKRRGELTPLPAEARDGVPQALLEIAVKAMAAERINRYPGVAELQQAIREYQAHAESIALVDRAREALAGAGRPAGYQPYTSCIGLLEQALMMWDANPQARRLLTEAKRGYAECAIGKGDLELAATIIGEDPVLATVREKLDAAQRAAAARHRSTRRAQLWAAVLVAAVVGLLAHFGIDYYRTFGRWQRVYHADFSRPGERLDGVAFSSPHMTSDRRAIERGRLMLPAAWALWLQGTRVRGDVRLEVRARWPRQVDGLELLINSRRRALDQLAWCPPGYACQFGGWRGEINAISRNDTAQPFNQGGSVAASLVPGRVYRLTFQRVDNVLSLLVDGREVCRQSDLLPLRGDSLDRIAVRSWSEVELLGIDVWRLGLAEKSTPLVAGDACVRQGDLAGAVSEYRTVAEDFAGSRMAERALAKAYLASCLAASIGDSVRNAIRDSLMRRHPRSRHLPVVLEAECVSMWARGRHEGALDLLSDVQRRDPQTRAALRIIAGARMALPPATARRLLEGLARTRRVHYLDLRSFGLTDLSPLAGMALRNLNVSDNRLTDLGPLAGMPLQTLACRNNDIVSVEPLRRMRLVRLDASINRISDLSPLAGAPLQDLDFEDNQVRSLAPLRGMPLTSLNCTGNAVSDLSPLAGMRLSSLSCRHNAIGDLSPLRGMPLTSLDCSENRVSDLSPLAGMPLRSLNIGFNDLSSLEPLAGMRLENLRCIANRVSDLRPLAGMPLAGLELDDNRISDITPLAGMPLASLHMDYNRVTSLGPLAGMPLGFLSIAGNPVADLRPLAGMPLWDLETFDTRITSLGPFESRMPHNCYFYTPAMDTGYAAAVLAAHMKLDGYGHNLPLNRIAMGVQRGDRRIIDPVAERFGGHRYAFCIWALRYEDARGRAAALGGHLLTLETEAEYEYLQSRGYLGTSWLGMERVGGAWVWATGAPVAFEAFSSANSRESPAPHFQFFGPTNRPVWFPAAAPRQRHDFIIEWDR